eukprot:272305_1
MELRYLTVHMQQHTKPFQCSNSKCNKSFSRKHDLKMHERLHSNTTELASCAFCGMKFTHPSNLRKHIKHFHAHHDGPKPFVCKHCKKRFDRKESLQKHFQVHLKPTDRKRHHCEECDTFFTLKSNLGKHLKKFHSLI